MLIYRDKNGARYKVGQGLGDNFKIHSDRKGRWKAWTSIQAHWHDTFEDAEAELIETASRRGWEAVEEE